MIVPGPASKGASTKPDNPSSPERRGRRTDCCRLASLLVGVTMALMEHHDLSDAGRKGFILLTVHQRESGYSSRPGTWCRGHGGVLLTDWLLMAGSVWCFFFFFLIDRDHQIRDGITYNGLNPPPSITIKNALQLHLQFNLMETFS